MTSPPPAPGHRPLSQRQNEPVLLQARAAARTAYGRAGYIRAIQTVGATTLALLAPVLSLLWPDFSGLLATIAVAWLVGARTAVDAWHRRIRFQAVLQQELFDTALFDLPWNTALAGPRRLAREELSTRPRPILQKDHGWYTNVPDIPWPLDVLACQAQNLMWSRRNHRSYARMLWCVLVVVSAGAIALGIARAMSLQHFVIQVAVPLIPTLLDLAELPRRHLDAARAQTRLEEVIDDLLARHSTGRAITAADCRELQDGIFEHRIHQPQVPTFVHRRLHAATSAAAEARMDDLREELTGIPT